MKKLISMVDFVLEQFNKWKEDNNPDCQSSARYILRTSNYAKFLKQPLELWMFVPCKLVDGVWVVLEEPKKENYLIHKEQQNNKGNIVDLVRFTILFKEYQEAKDRVLFEGFYQNIFNETGSFEIINDSGFQVCAYKALPRYFLWLGCPEDRTVESAIQFHKFTLTPTALKQIGL